MKTSHGHIGLVSQKEAWPLAYGGSLLFYRRFSLGVLASLERQHSVLLPAEPGGAPCRQTVNRRALEAAICAHVLVGWQNVRDHRGEPVEFSPGAALKLPASVKNRILEAAMNFSPPPGQIETREVLTEPDEAAGSEVQRKAY